MAVPSVKLNNGIAMPVLGLGTWNSPKGQVTQAVKDAIDAGYRHIDGAHVYENENEVGEGIAQKIKEGVIKREDIFVTSKLWNTYHRPELVRGACETTLKKLGLSYVDMYLIHWPMGFKEGDELFPLGPDGKIVPTDIDYVDTWKEMEKLVAAGLCKSIGISNFTKSQIARVLAVAKITPATNQIECHPYLQQKELADFCKSKNIVITAYSPLGSPHRPNATADDPILLEDPKIVSIAEKHGKNAAQILIRFQIQLGNIAIPKSVTKSRIISNFDVFNFELSEDDMAAIKSLDRNKRFVDFDITDKHPLYPFSQE